MSTLSVSSRRLFLRRSTAIAIAGGSAAVLLGSTPALADHKKKRHPERGPEDLRDEFTSIRQHENDHVAALVAALGADARPKPTFQNLLQYDFSAFRQVSQALENTGCGAYLGAAPFIDSMDYLAAAGSIALIEGRHAGFLNELQDDPITATVLDDDSDNSFETPLTPAQVLDQAGGFVKSLNGGPPADYAPARSPANDIDILNFALLLEYLEAEFYNLNVARFYGH